MGAPIFLVSACASGEWRLLRADILHDAGQSINPALDIGQVEGGFVQGMGWLTTEELWWNRDGRLMTHAPSTYKIPAVSDTPAAFNVQLYQNQNAEPTVFHSKAGAGASSAAAVLGVPRDSRRGRGCGTGRGKCAGAARAGNTRSDSRRIG